MEFRYSDLLWLIYDRIGKNYLLSRYEYGVIGRCSHREERPKISPIKVGIITEAMSRAVLQIRTSQGVSCAWPLDELVDSSGRGNLRPLRYKSEDLRLLSLEVTNKPSSSKS